ncbi:MAG: hypothetical protein IPM99_17610 [Rubrivivax sp.]|nr:hypothetical protein [Rubrivivax sp.]
MAGEIRFTRLDNGAAVELAHFPQSGAQGPPWAGRPDARCPGTAGGCGHARGLCRAWQDWVRTILIDHADDPALIAVVA